MEKKILLTVKKYALVEIEHEHTTSYVVVSGYNEEDQTWGQNTYFDTRSNNPEDRALRLMKATEFFYKLINKDYITRDRMAEIATRFKDELFEWADKEEALEYVDNDLDLTYAERCFFELDE